MRERHQFAAPCGLYCGACGMYGAHRNNDLKLGDKLTAIHGLNSEDIRCVGCLAESDNVFFYCRVCTIKDYTKEKGFEGCYQCNEFPCKIIDEFPVPVGKKVMLRPVPPWCEFGPEKWMDEEKDTHARTAALNCSVLRSDVGTARKQWIWIERSSRTVDNCGECRHQSRVCPKTDHLKTES